MSTPAGTPRDALREGRLADAVAALGAELRDHPGDAQRRTFLFELLCFAGEYERAGKQLDVLAAAGPEAGAGALTYRAALDAERSRAALFRDGGPPSDGAERQDVGEHAVAGPVTGVLNGRPFSDLRDADPRVGARLEAFVAGRYVWLPLAHLASVRAEAPRRLRDLLWVPAVVRAGPALRGAELGEVLLPALAPRTSEHPDDLVRLGRVTAWQPLDDGREAPAGQKLWLVDGEEFPLLELRELDVAPPPPAAPAA